jgi:spore maturation protein CgeB
VPKRLPVSFVGLPHGDRRYVAQALRDAGIDVHTFGKGWGVGRVTQSQMIRIFNESCINLNLANASTAGSRLDRSFTILRNVLARLPLTKYGRRAGVRTLSALESKLLGPRPAAHGEQIKGRNFEVPGCGAFLLTADVENLQDYYDRGREIACYGDTADLIVQVRTFLADPDRRESIARAGRERTLRQHTYAHRFEAIFGRSGLAPVPADQVLAGLVEPGRTDDAMP